MHGAHFTYMSPLLLLSLLITYKYMALLVLFVNFPFTQCAFICGVQLQKKMRAVYVQLLFVSIFVLVNGICLICSSFFLSFFQKHNRDFSTSFLHRYSPLSGGIFSIQSPKNCCNSKSRN